MTQPLIGVAGGWGVEKALEVAGARTVDIERVADLDYVARYLDAIVLTGGSDVDPKRYGQKLDGAYGIDYARDNLEFKLVEVAQDNGLNMMGICRGNQLLNVAHGGTLFQDIEDFTVYDHWGTMANVMFRQSSSMAPSLSELEVYGTHYHHQAIDRVGDGLMAAAWSADAIIEAVESVPSLGYYVLGTQFHPEMDYQKDKDCAALFEHFVNVTRAKAQGKREASERQAMYLSDTSIYKPKSFASVSYTAMGGWKPMYDAGLDAYGRRPSQVDAVRDANDDDNSELAFLNMLNEDDEYDYWEEKGPSATDRRSRGWASFCNRNCESGACWSPEYCSPLDGECQESEWRDVLARDAKGGI